MGDDVIPWVSPGCYCKPKAIEIAAETHPKGAKLPRCRNFAPPNFGSGEARYSAGMKLVLAQPKLSFDSRADNLATVSRLLEPMATSLEGSDIVLLPEHFELRTSRAEYEAAISRLSRHLGCHVVGGSHHEDRDGFRINRGVVSDGSGQMVGAYEKLRPYADERSRVRDGSVLGEFSIAGVRVLVLICADFWFSDLFYRATSMPDLVLVPALSVTRKPTPVYSRALWQHLSIARAYEFGVYVGVSDWAYAKGAAPGLLPASGVGGLADPTGIDPEAFFLPIEGELRTYDLDFEALSAFRRDRQVRGFFWKQPQP
jgi:predicted amidohydrolase